MAKYLSKVEPLMWIIIGWFAHERGYQPRIEGTPTIH